MFWVLMFAICALICLSGFTAGMYLGYHRGVGEVVKMNDASYRQKLEIETKNYADRALVDTQAYRERMAITVAASREPAAPEPKPGAPSLIFTPEKPLA